MISVNYNSSVLKAQNNLSKANIAMNVALQRMSTGYKINSAADNAAGLYISTGLNTQIRGLKQAQKNIVDGINILNIAESSLRNMGNMLNRVRDLALQGANSYYSSDSRQALQSEADKLLEEIVRIKNSTSFNGRNLFESGKNSAPARAAAFSAPAPKRAFSRAAAAPAAQSDSVPDGYTAIYSADDLNNIRNNMSGKYILMADIDLSGVDFSSIGGESGFVAFTGILDGNGHAVKNLKCDSGLFVKTENAQIKNLGLENVDITETGYTGGIVAEASNTTISNCYSTGVIHSSYASGGGIVGYAYDGTTITDCYSTASVSAGYDYAGGIVGMAGSSYDGSRRAVNISNCCFTGSAFGEDGAAGGIAGSSENTNISNCSSTGSITSDSIAGGIVGVAYSNTTISDCSTSGTISGAYESGGFIGEAADGYTNVSISDCYTTANVQAASNGAGLLVGYVFWNGDGLTANNIICNADKSEVKDIGNSAYIVGSPEALTNEEFSNPSNWSGFNSSSWDTSTYPPTLKNLPINQNKPPGSGGSAGGSIRLQVGPNADEATNAIYLDLAFNLETLTVDLLSTDGCIEALKTVDEFLDKINNKMTDIGASQNRLESSTQSLVIQIENFTAAKSTIMDADIATESAEYTKQQILTQTTTALLVQANRSNANAIIGLINSMR